VKPPFPYFGGKILSADWLISLMPAHRHYVEPFSGSLAVLLAKRPVVHETVNDLDGDLINFWRVLRERPDELIRAAALTPHSRSEHRSAYDDQEVDDLERARRVWVQLSQGRAGVRSRTGWRHYIDPGDTSSSMPGYLRGYVDRMAPVAERLSRVSLECRPALEVIAAYGQQPEVLLYVDPPYLGTTRSSGGYLHEMTGGGDHEDLLAALLDCKASVVLSGYASDLYDEALSGWTRRTKDVGTGQSGEWGSRVEVAWCNRPVADGGLLDLLEEGVA
jgi:DNA adenine methylase